MNTIDELIETLKESAEAADRRCAQFEQWWSSRFQRRKQRRSQSDHETKAEGVTTDEDDAVTSDDETEVEDMSPRWRVLISKAMALLTRTAYIALDQGFRIAERVMQRRAGNRNGALDIYDILAILFECLASKWAKSRVPTMAV